MAETEIEREPGDDEEPPVQAGHIRWTETPLPAIAVRQLRCVCCGTWYARGSFRCCAPPNGMSSATWLGLACKSVKDGGCGKCWRHCACANKVARTPKGPLADELAAFVRRLPGGLK